MNRIQTCGTAQAAPDSVLVVTCFLYLDTQSTVQHVHKRVDWFIDVNIIPLANVFNTYILQSFSFSFPLSVCSLLLPLFHTTYLLWLWTLTVLLVTHGHTEALRSSALILYSAVGLRLRIRSHIRTLSTSFNTKRFQWIHMQTINLTLTLSVSLSLSDTHKVFLHSCLPVLLWPQFASETTLLCLWWQQIRIVVTVCQTLWLHEWVVWAWLCTHGHEGEVFINIKC